MSLSKTNKQWPVEDRIICLLVIVCVVAFPAKTTPHFWAKLSVDPSWLDEIHELHLSLLRSLAVHLTGPEIVDHLLQLGEDGEG